MPRGRPPSGIPDLHNARATPCQRRQGGGSGTQRQSTRRWSQLVARRRTLPHHLLTISKKLLRTTRPLLRNPSVRKSPIFASGGLSVVRAVTLVHHYGAGDRE